MEEGSGNSLPLPFFFSLGRTFSALRNTME